MRTDSFIPRRLDDQWKIGFWDVDVAAPVLFFLMLGYLTGSKLLMVGLTMAGLWVARWMGRMKADKHPAFALHWLYWYLPTSPFTSMKSTPAASVGRMVG